MHFSIMPILKTKQEKMDTEKRKFDCAIQIGYRTDKYRKMRINQRVSGWNECAHSGVIHWTIYTYWRTWIYLLKRSKCKLEHIIQPIIHPIRKQQTQTD